MPEKTKTVMTNNSRQDMGQGMRQSSMQIFLASLKLGLTSFGGPIAHLGYFHHEYVKRRKWMDEKAFADLVALCQFLPGPASSQVGIGIGFRCAGWAGALAAWCGFTLPSVLILVLFAFIMRGMNLGDALWLHGLKLTAVAIVAQAVWNMGTKLAYGRSRASIALAAAGISLLWQSAISQVVLITAAAGLGLYLYRKEAQREPVVAGHVVEPADTSYSRSRRIQAATCLALYFALLLLLPLLSRWSSGEEIHLFDSFYRAGSLVFGGGHVVLPLLQEEVVPRGWVSLSDFIAGYGAAQAVPGPLFTFAAYLGALHSGITGAVIATAAIFLPGFLLVAGVLPIWDNLRCSEKVQGALQGINAAVVGLLLAALYDPIWTGAVVSTYDFIVILGLFAMLVVWKLPPWCVVIAGAMCGMLMGFI